MAYTPGPFSRAHLYMQWGGKLPGGESWSCGLRLAGNGPDFTADTPPEDDVRDWMNGSMTSAVQQFHTREFSYISEHAKLSFLKLNRIGTDGRYSNPVTNEHVFADIAGQATGPGPANQLTIAVSLTTGFSRGPAHRGRFYLPMPAIGPAADGLIDPVYATRIAGSTKAFLEAIADIPGVDYAGSLTPVVMSRKLGAATYRVITGVQVGRVIDTQRRRRKSLREIPASSNLDLGQF